MKNKFLQISIGVSMMLLAGGFFVRSISTANAAPPSPKEFVAEGTNQIGVYQMNFYQGLNSQGSDQYSILVWNTQTGKSTWYYYDYTAKDWVPSTKQLPANPLSN